MTWKRTNIDVHEAVTHLGTLSILGHKGNRYANGSWRILWTPNGSHRFYVVMRNLSTIPLAKRTAETWFTEGTVNGLRVRPEGM